MGGAAGGFYEPVCYAISLRARSSKPGTDVAYGAARAKGLFRVEGGKDEVFYNVKDRGITWKWPGPQC
eukprot:2240026-Rhodomonas_salina.1